MTTSHWPIVTEHEMMVMWSVPIVLFLLIVVWLRVICTSASLALSNDRVVFFSSQNRLQFKSNNL